MNRRGFFSRMLASAAGVGVAAVGVKAAEPERVIINMAWAERKELEALRELNPATHTHSLSYVCGCHTHSHTYGSSHTHAIQPVCYAHGTRRD